MRRTALLCLAALFTACASNAPRPNLIGRTLYTVDGAPFTFSEQAGKVLLVTYLATWSLPCLAHVQHLVSLQERLGPRGLQVVAVGVDTQGAVVLQPFRDHYQLPFPMVLADAETLEGRTPFGLLVGLPSSFLVDRQGRLVRSIYGIVETKVFDAEVQRAIDSR
jgi:peroxiredoxin